MIFKTHKYIELVGVAGVGKSTSTNMIIHEAKKLDLPIEKRIPVTKNGWIRLKIIFNIIKLLCFTPQILRLYFIPINNNYKNTPYVKKIKFNLITRMIIDIAVINFLLKISKNFVINDEGLIGKLISLTILIKLPQSEAYKIIKKLLPKPSIIIYVTASPLIALEREHKRKINLPFFDYMDISLKRSFYNEAEEKYKQLPKIFKKNKFIKEMFINNSRNYNNLNSEILEIITKLKK